MTTKQERERLLQGLDAGANAITEYLRAQGWSVERILKNVAGKVYLPHRATIRVELDTENQQYWVTGEYTSKGENVLSTCYGQVKTTASTAEMSNEMSRFLKDLESCINQSFAVRFRGELMAVRPSARTNMLCL